MEPFTTALEAGLKLAELGSKLLGLVDHARGQPVELRVLSYLQVAQRSLQALGRERQGILSEATQCDLQHLSQVESLSRRLTTYLQEDNVRAPFQQAIEGLAACRKDLERQSNGLRWRRQDRKEALRDFVAALESLVAQAQGLEHSFFPQFSGQGLETLIPIRDLINHVRDDLRRHPGMDVRDREAVLAQLLLAALRDPAHVRWETEAARLERLVVELQLAFSVR